MACDPGKLRKGCGKMVDGLWQEQMMSAAAEEGRKKARTPEPEQQKQKAPDEGKALDAGAEAAEGGESEEDEDAEDDAE
ncbi:hypothetical protein AK812_SmicGene12805 [Symbiodinium microadriaticum]|uniref:Uncharacterized protein n=1 Tax=Symbiodinium microadriaticum TaxID=2951 RepID=A0A1Q9E9S8_SYMMI|nr:hypothetical protein AK812_SmicGene12805 [Symbiodinium microadriaticum]